MKVNLKIKRKYLKKDYTIGDLYYSLDGGFNWVYLCNTLEDTVRDYNKDGDLDDIGEEKVYGETAIPYGNYDVVIDHSPKYGRDMLRILDVNSFTGILIHAGNSNEDTYGCVLLGWNTIKGRLTDSKKAVDMLYELVDRNGRKAKLIIE